MLNNALHCIAFTSTLVETQRDARIDSDPILAFPCAAFLHLIIKKSPIFLVINFCVSRVNVMQGLASLCEPALIRGLQLRHTYMWFMILLLNLKKIRSISIAQVSPEGCGLGETQHGCLKQLYSTEMEQWPLSDAVKVHYSININYLL